MNPLDHHIVQEIREEIYLGKGYYIFRSFLPSESVAHLQKIWQQPRVNASCPNFNKNRHIRLNGKDLSTSREGLVRHFNFFWNTPKDQPTYHFAWRLQLLRNQIEGLPEDWGFLPNYPSPGEVAHLRYVTSYRLVFTKMQGAVPVHADWALDHSKIQLSLMLTSFGEDYQEGGLVIYDRFRGGQPVNISEKEQLRAGDLVVFRYAHPHAVAPVQSAGDQLGFGRMLLPLEVVDTREQSGVFKLKKELFLLAVRFGHKISKWVSIPGDLNYQRALTSRATLLRSQGLSLYYGPSVQKLMDIAIQEGLSPAHVYLAKGLWGRFALFQEWQMAVLQQYGLSSEHYFLDVGCGILRLGMELIPFLEDGHYCGVDSTEQYIKLGERYVEEVVKTEKNYQLLTSRDFEFERFKKTFDFAMAQSVFTHMSFGQIEQCFHALKKVMKPEGKFLFTLILGKEQEKEIIYIDGQPMTKSSHSSTQFYYELAKKLKITIHFPTDHKHPSQQLGVAFF